MTAAVADHGSGGRRRRRTTTTARADDASSGGRRQRTTTAREIGRLTTRGKEENGRRTTTALDKRLISPPGREHEKIKNSSLRKKTFSAIRSVRLDFLLVRKQPMCPFWSISLIWYHSITGTIHLGGLGKMYDFL
jgi:hypothetical protein